MTEHHPEVLTVAQAASLLQLSITTTRRLIRRGALPSVSLGRSLRVPRVALLALLDKRAHKGVSE